VQAPDWSSSALLAYMGLGSGLEFLPYFFALMSLVGAALVATVQWPVLVVIRRLKGGHKGMERQNAANATQQPSARSVDGGYQHTASQNS
jgi:hypothetical protein